MSQASTELLCALAASGLAPSCANVSLVHGKRLWPGFPSVLAMRISCQSVPLEFTPAPSSCFPSLSLELWLCSWPMSFNLAWYVLETASSYTASHPAMVLYALRSSYRLEHDTPRKYCTSLKSVVISEGSFLLLNAPNCTETQQMGLLLKAVRLFNWPCGSTSLRAHVPDSQSPRNLMLHVKNTMFTWSLLPRLEPWLSRPGQPIN